MAGLEVYEDIRRLRSTTSCDSRNDFARVYEERKVAFPLGILLLPFSDKDEMNDYNDFSKEACIKKVYVLASRIAYSLLSHPFIVLRRQCQVNPTLKNYHIAPCGLIVVIVRLHQTQSLNTLWKGIGSVLLVRGMTLAVEDFICRTRGWPNVSIGVTVPFYSASLIETVQSEIASETPGALDVFRNGVHRLVNVSNKGRLVPIYLLLKSTIFYEVSKYLFTVALQGGMSCAGHIYHFLRSYTGAYNEDLAATDSEIIRLRTSLNAAFLADVLYFPFETVIHRLHLQGTRTIIDDLDTGLTVTPLLTGYSGVRDCYETIISTEGVLGLYKGFGALLWQLAVHVTILRATSWIL